MTTKQQTTKNIHVNKLHANLEDTGEDSMCATANHLHYSVKGVLEVFEGCTMVKSKHKLPRKVTED